MDRYNPASHTPLNNTRLTAEAAALRAGRTPGSRATGGKHLPTPVTRERDAR
jgi:hypothetical protein